MITINNSTFEAQGANVKDKVFGITLTGAEDVMIKDCVFKNKGYSAIYNNCTGNVQIEDCVFECGNMYNPIEGSQSVENGNVAVKNCEFKGFGGNNYVNFYNVKPGSAHSIENCTFEPSVDTNVLRLSNRNNAKAVFTVANCKYDFAEGEAHDYTALLICQDYTNKNGVKQNFDNYTVKLDNVVCNGSKLTKVNEAAKGTIYYVYEDGVGLITGENDPIINIL